MYIYIYIYIFAIFFFLSFSSLFYSVCSFFSRCYCCRRYFVWNTRHAWMRCKMHLMAEETDRSFNAYVNSCFTVFRDCLSINHISLVMVPWREREREKERERDRHKSIDFRLRRSRIETATTGTRSISVDTGKRFSEKNWTLSLSILLNSPSYDSFYPISYLYSVRINYINR